MAALFWLCLVQAFLQSFKQLFRLRKSNKSSAPLGAFSLSAIEVHSIEASKLWTVLSISVWLLFFNFLFLTIGTLYFLLPILELELQTQDPNADTKLTAPSS